MQIPALRRSGSSNLTALMSKFIGDTENSHRPQMSLAKSPRILEVRFARAGRTHPRGALGRLPVFPNQ